MEFPEVPRPPFVYYPPIAFPIKYQEKLDEEVDSPVRYIEYEFPHSGIFKRTLN